MIGLVSPGKAFGIAEVEGAVDSGVRVGASVVPTAAVQLSLFGIDPAGVMELVLPTIRTRVVVSKLGREVD